MPASLMGDPRVRSVEWRDLLALSTTEIVLELLLSGPWLAASLFLASRGAYALALPLSFIFFLTGLRQVHNAHHYALGISRRATEWVMFGLSVLMLSSMHAIQVTHLHHHRTCMDDEDVEAESARMSALRALLFGPLFPFRLHREGLRLASARQRAWIQWEIAMCVAWVCLCWLTPGISFLKYHVLAMCAGQCLTAFFAVWTVHHGCDGRTTIARTLRHKLKSIIVFDMFFHIEHHLFPRVPTCHLGTLADRLDAAAPEVVRLKVF